MPIASPEVYREMLDRAKANKFAYPAINVTSSETLNAALRGFAEAESDGIVQVSTGGAEFASGTKVKDMVTGAVALAEYAHVVAAKYPINVALHTDHCPKDKLDGYVRPLLAISAERVGRGKSKAKSLPHLRCSGGFGDFSRDLWPGLSCAAPTALIRHLSLNKEPARRRRYG